MGILLLACVSSLILGLLQLIRTRYYGGLNKIPGPFVASVSNIWKVSALYWGTMPQENIAIHSKYGSVVRIGPHHVSFASPEALQIIHTSRNAYPKVYDHGKYPQLAARDKVNQYYSPTSINQQVLSTKITLCSIFSLHRTFNITAHLRKV